VPTIHNDDELGALPMEEQLRYERALRALRRMAREHIGPGWAAQLEDADPDDVERFFAPALGLKRGERVVLSTHHVPLPYKIATPDGTRQVWIADPRQRSLIGGWWHAAERALGGDERALAKYEGSFLVVNGERIPLVTDLERLTELVHANEVGYEGIYELT
jgi:hypothetical protein